MNQPGDAVPVHPKKICRSRKGDKKALRNARTLLDNDSWGFF